MSQRWLLAALLLGCEAVTPPAATELRDAPTPTSPFAAATPPVAGRERFVGVVEERLEAGSYTYLAVRTDQGLHWVATMGDGPATGTRVVVRNMGTRTDFHSRRLDRTFSELVFGVVDDAA